METISNETLILAVKEVLEEQAKINLHLNDQGTAINIIMEKVNLLSKKQENKNSLAPEQIVEPIKKVIQQKFADLKFEMDLLRVKAPVNNLQLFLQSDAMRWIVILIVCCLFLTYLYFWIRR